MSNWNSFTPEERKEQVDKALRAHRIAKANKRSKVERRRDTYALKRTILDDVQGGECPLCSTRNPVGLGWHLDHDHACEDHPSGTWNDLLAEDGRNLCSCVRGVLCGNCNTVVLAQIENFPDIYAPGPIVRRYFDDPPARDPKVTLMPFPGFVDPDDPRRPGPAETRGGDSEIPPTYREGGPIPKTGGRVVLYPGELA